MTTTLYDMIRTVLDESTETDPRVIAADVLAAIPDEGWREVVSPALVSYVSSLVTRSRQGVPTQPNRPQVVRSAKVAGIRDDWQRFLGERVQVEGTWKRVAECTVQDVQALARERREVAAKNVAHATRFEKLAEDMQAQGAATVAEFKPGRQPQLAKAS